MQKTGRENRQKVVEPAQGLVEPGVKKQSGFSKIALTVTGVATVALSSLGVYAFTQKQFEEPLNSPISIDLPDALTFDCDVKEVVDDETTNGIYCNKQEVRGRIIGPDSMGENTITANAENVELNNGEFTQSMEYKFPEETYNLETFDMGAIKENGVDDELVILIQDNDTGEILATKTLKIHYDINDEDVDKIVYYIITISNVTIEQVHQIIIKNNPHITEEELEAMIQRREERIAAEKEAERIKQQEEAAKQAEQNRIENLRNDFMRLQSYKASSGDLCIDSDYRPVHPMLDGYEYEVSVGCLLKNPSGSNYSGIIGTDTEKIRLKVFVRNIPSDVPPVVEPPVCINEPQESQDDDCRARIREWQYEYEISHRALQEEVVTTIDRLLDRVVLKHSRGASSPSHVGYIVDVGYGSDRRNNGAIIEFQAPKNATNFVIEINGYETGVPIALEWPLNFEVIVSRTNPVTIPENLRCLITNNCT